MQNPAGALTGMVMYGEGSDLLTDPDHGPCSFVLFIHNTDLSWTPESYGFKPANENLSRAS
jgi:hypothetical protein